MHTIERAFGILKKRFPIIASTTEPMYSIEGIFTSRAYESIVKELVDKFDMQITKDKVKNRMKTLKFVMVNAMTYIRKG
jgi:hypothetical protein